MCPFLSWWQQYVGKSEEGTQLTPVQLQRFCSKTHGMLAALAQVVQSVGALREATVIESEVGHCRVSDLLGASSTSLVPAGDSCVSTQVRSCAPTV